MNPAEYLAALKALEAGLKDQIEVAKRAVLDAAVQAGAERFTTPYGPVTVSRDAPRVEVTDEAAFTDWCDANLPDAVETVRRVRPATAKAALNQLVVLRGRAYDPGTGEEVPWATVTEPGDPYVAWPASPAQRETKIMARLLFEDRALGLAAGLRELTGGETDE